MKRLFSMSLKRRGSEYLAEFGKTKEIASVDAACGAVLLLLASDNMEFRDVEFNWLVDKLTKLQGELWEQICRAPDEPEERSRSEES